MKKVGIAGSTGSIGTNALNVIKRHPEIFSVAFLTANKQVRKLAEQTRYFHPRAVAIADESGEEELKYLLNGFPVEIYSGEDSISYLCRNEPCDVVLNAIVGSRGLRPSVETILSGKDLALSNKESLVMAGDCINEIAKEKNVCLLPVDSEHSAIWQCLAGEEHKNIKSLYLTGSGGPFRDRDPKTFHLITVEEALKHPNWSMGAKITVDSATMMNKGLEVIEAYHLFHVPADDIKVLIHPQSIVHSLVCFNDGSVKAQLGIPDMKIPIQYALSWPDRFDAEWEDLDLITCGPLTFSEPDHVNFPAVNLARQALQNGGNAPAVLNVANEQAVYRFLGNEIPFTQIIPFTEAALEKFASPAPCDIDSLLQLEKDVTEFIKKHSI